MAACDIEVRPIPYPYRALLAICSDLDETPDRHAYWETMRFLNTTADTRLGPGLGLEVGNSIYFDMPAEQFSYWNTDEAGRRMVKALIRSGHVDCLHSYGDCAMTRSHAARALEELDRHGCRPQVWIDHAVAPSNFGADIMCGHGDVPGTDVYHADLTCGFGVHYVWRGRVTSVLGQNQPRSLRGIPRWRHPLRSVKTVTKEVLKNALARVGDQKYAMHSSNEVLRRTQLRDGRPVYEFLRSNPYWGGVEHAATADGLADVLSPATLQRLIDRGGVCVLYTHLGKIRRREELFTERTRNALQHLARLYHEKQILVTTTRRLLGFCRALREVRIHARHDEHGWSVDLRTTTASDRSTVPLSGSDLSGFTVYVPDPDKTRLGIDGSEVEEVLHNSGDHTGRRSVSVPWCALEFREL
jgi:hypothetical protein